MLQHQDNMRYEINFYSYKQNLFLNLARIEIEHSCEVDFMKYACGHLDIKDGIQNI